MRLARVAEAIDRFDLDRGLAFSSFTVQTILGELSATSATRAGWSGSRVMCRSSPGHHQDHRVADERAGRPPTPAELADRSGATVEQLLEARAANSARRPELLDKPVTEDGEQLLDLAGGSIDPGYEHADTAAVVDGLLATLGEREREILRLRFAGVLTQAEIGEQMGLSQMHVSRLIRRSISALQAAG